MIANVRNRTSRSHCGVARARAFANPARVDARQGFTDATGHTLRDGGDDAQVIQAAINQAASMGGAAVYVGSGPLTFLSSLAWTQSGIDVLGDGPGSTVVTVAYSPNGDVIAIGSPSNNPGYCSVSQMEFALGAGYTQTSGALMHVTNGHDIVFEKIASWGTDDSHDFLAHYYVNGGPEQYITWLRDLEINPTHSQAGLAAITIGGGGLGGSEANEPQDTWIENVEIGGNGTANCGIALYNSGGCQLQDVAVTSCFMALATYPGSSQQVVNVFLDQFLGDGCRDRAFLIGTGGGQVASVHAINSWFSSTGINWQDHPEEGAGLTIGGDASAVIDSLSFTNCHLYSNWGHGAEILQFCENVDFIGCQLSGNSFGAPGTSSGLAIAATPTISGVSIIGGRANGKLWAGWPTVQQYGYNIGAGVGNVTIANVQAIGNLVDGINDQSG